jgi:hypothetical protein
MTPTDVRAEIIARLEQDLIGPHKHDEVIEGVRVKPSDIYLTGILWPLGELLGSEEDEKDEGEDEDDTSPSTASPIGQQRPCTMGVSFSVDSLSPSCSVDIQFNFGIYIYKEVPRESNSPSKNSWKRKQFEITIQKFELPDNGFSTKFLTAPGLDLSIELYARCRTSKIGRLVTISIINRSQCIENDSVEIESKTLFQTQLIIKATKESTFLPRPPRPAANDEDEEVSMLLYRKNLEYAAGHQCAVSWKEVNGVVAELKTEWIPKASVTAFKEDGDEVFDALIKNGTFDAESLSNFEKNELLDRLCKFSEAYGHWISQKENEIIELAADLKIIAKRNLEICRKVQFRISNGIDALNRNENLLEAFQLANAAMSLQHSWKGLARGQNLRWRPFQLGFILLAAESVCIGEAPDRDIFDLLWFPTGGGKTEAYLALVAMLAFHRRLAAKDPDIGAGNAAVMRYTLRLLTAQQFERATSLILACDLIRRGKFSELRRKDSLGTIPISIGLWVGGDATPNKYKDAAANRGSRGLATAEQISECPCCHKKIRWDYNELEESVAPYCENSDCNLGTSFGLWPVYTIDNMIYRERPTLLIGTIDKFALVATREEVSSLFGFGTQQSTDLIIQDELHLISGPLGTIAGLYETAFDWLLAKEKVRPKIIGSTATIRRASEQVRALFDRESCQFPPPGLEHDDSGFAVRDKNKEPRIYLGVTTAGRSAKFVLQATAASLLQSAGPASIKSDLDRDGYATLLGYFNSLRELGGAIVQMLDDVPDAIRIYADKRGELSRRLGPPRELTSRVSQNEIVEILSELKVSAGNPGTIDMVLATNMVSVGVDVSRLGMMLMNGQPKTRSEYIQATSRVGRSVFPGLVLTVLNAAKPRDRSHFETFLGWHSCLYKDVEATSVTPFASRSRDRALHAALVAMVRHGSINMLKKPNLNNAPSELLSEVIDEIERRVNSIDPSERNGCANELDELLRNWEDREPVAYSNPFRPNTSLLISADINAQRKASGRLPAAAWPTMNNMRSVEATTRFRMAEFLKDGTTNGASSENSNGESSISPQAPRWRKK